MYPHAITRVGGEDGSSPVQAFCHLCGVNVDPTSKHCRQCNKCIIGFDHHCRWLNNCVGFRNYRPFLASVFASLLGSVLIFAASAALIAFYYYVNYRYEGRWLGGSGSHLNNTSSAYPVPPSVSGPCGGNGTSPNGTVVPLATTGALRTNHTGPIKVALLAFGHVTNSSYPTSTSTSTPYPSSPSPYYSPKPIYTGTNPFVLFYLTEHLTCPDGPLGNLMRGRVVTGFGPYTRGKFSRFFTRFIPVNAWVSILGITLLLSLVATLVLGHLAAFHLYIRLKGISTYEYIKRQGESRDHRDLGIPIQNPYTQFPTTSGKAMGNTSTTNGVKRDGTGIDILKGVSDFTNKPKVVVSSAEDKQSRETFDRHRMEDEEISTSGSPYYFFEGNPMMREMEKKKSGPQATPSRDQKVVVLGSVAPVNIIITTRETTHRQLPATPKAAGAEVSEARRSSGSGKGSGLKYAEAEPMNPDMESYYFFEGNTLMKELDSIVEEKNIHKGTKEAEEHRADDDHVVKAAPTAEPAGYEAPYYFYEGNPLMKALNSGKLAKADRGRIITQTDLKHVGTSTDRGSVDIPDEPSDGDVDQEPTTSKALTKEVVYISEPVIPDNFAYYYFFDGGPLMRELDKSREKLGTSSSEISTPVMDGKMKQRKSKISNASTTPSGGESVTRVDSVKVSKKMSFSNLLGGKKIFGKKKVSETDVLWQARKTAKKLEGDRSKPAGSEVSVDLEFSKSSLQTSAVHKAAPMSARYSTGKEEAAVAVAAADKASRSRPYNFNNNNSNLRDFMNEEPYEMQKALKMDYDNEFYIDGTKRGKQVMLEGSGVGDYPLVTNKTLDYYGPSKLNTLGSRIPVGPKRRDEFYRRPIFGQNAARNIVSPGGGPERRTDRSGIDLATLDVSDLPKCSKGGSARPVITYLPCQQFTKGKIYPEDNFSNV